MGIIPQKSLSLPFSVFMRYTFNTVCFIFLVLFLISCGSSRHSKKAQAALPGTWQSQPIIIDGDSKDWPSPYPNYDAKAKVAYATSNDKENLYITMETGDEMTQIKILKQGLTVSIDTGGGKNPDFNINFPLQNDLEPLEISKKDFGQSKGSMDAYENKQMEKKISKSALDANQLSLDGFIHCNGGYMAKQTTPCGIMVRMSIDEYKELVWEAVIPFKAIYNKETITAADAGKHISVCFSVKAFKKQESKGGGDNGAGNGGGMNNGMGGAGSNSSMHGGGRGGGGKGGSKAPAENPMQHLYESTKTWKFFGLAFQQL